MHHVFFLYITNDFIRYLFILFIWKNDFLCNVMVYGDHFLFLVFCFVFFTKKTCKTNLFAVQNFCWCPLQRALVYLLLCFVILFHSLCNSNSQRKLAKKKLIFQWKNKLIWIICVGLVFSFVYSLSFSLFFCYFIAFCLFFFYFIFLFSTFGNVLSQLVFI